MYMHVYVCICMYTKPAQVNACICMYMHIYVCICCICMYFVCICMYFLKWHPLTQEPMPRPRNTVSRGGSRRAALRAPQVISASTFFRHRQRLCRLDLAHPTPAARVQGHWSCPLVQLGGLPCTIRALQSSPMACHIRSGWLESVQRPVSAGCTPSKTPPDR